MGSMATRGFPNRFHGNEGVPQPVGHCSPQRRPSWRPRRLRKRRRRRRRRRRTRPEQGGECEQRVAVSGDKHLRKGTLRGSALGGVLGRQTQFLAPQACSAPPRTGRDSIRQMSFTEIRRFQVWVLKKGGPLLTGLQSETKRKPPFLLGG